MAQADPFFEGALAPARWPHELEKPNPGFGRGGLGRSGWRGVRFFAGLPGPVILFFAGLWYAVWHFVRLGRFHRTKRLRESSSARSIIRSKRGRFLTPRGSPSRSADSIPAWRYSEPWDRGKPALACTRLLHDFMDLRRHVDHRIPGLCYAICIR